MDKIHYYRGTMTDGKQKSTDIFKLGPSGINDALFQKQASWEKTPFKNVRFCRPAEAWNDDYKFMLTKNTITKLPLADYVMELRKALRDYWVSVLDPDEQYLIFHSGGYDSRSLSLSLMELRDSGHPMPEIHFRCHQPEEPMFLEIMKRQGWDKSQYSVYEGPAEDYYDIGRKDRPLNGWQHYNQQLNFWGDIAPNEKEWILITGLGGEMYKYLALDVKHKTARVKNRNLNLLIDHYPHEGQWEGYWRRLFKELLMPFWSYRYLSVSTTANPAFCEPYKDTDSVRWSFTESYKATHGIDCANIEYGRHDYSWSISEKRKQQMRDDYYTSAFHKDYGHRLGHMEFFDLKPGSASWHYDSCVWGFMTCYDEMKRLGKI